MAMSSQPSPRQLTTPRAAAVAGVIFALLFGAVLILIRTNMPEGAAASSEWLNSRGRGIAAAATLMPFAGISFLWFIGVVRDGLGRYEDKFFASVFLGSGVLFIAMLFVLAAIFGALLGVAGLHSGNPPLDIWQLGRQTTFNLASIYAVRMGAVFMIAASTIAFRLRIHSRIVAVVGYAAALLLLFASSSIPWLQLVFPVWVLLVSINIVILSYRKAGSPAETAYSR